MINWNMDHNEDVGSTAVSLLASVSTISDLNALADASAWCFAPEYPLLWPRLPSSAKLFRAKLLCSYIHCPGTDRQTLK
jgi:hypothetical protein